MTRITKLALLAVFAGFPLLGASPTIPQGAKVFISPMSGFETYIKAAVQKKKLPLVIVEQRDQADFEISGSAESQKASTAKKVIMLDWHSTEQASVRVTDLKSSEVVFAYSVHKASSARGKQSSAEACAKHLKEAIKISNK
ncbi:MAG: hypothetical protein JWP63_249 [Candidatus Solibacter sp.]|nr:hypothetical protein [Candidatus Solibacter sp.]